MASAQLSSPHHAGAGSDLRETAPAGHGVPLGSSTQGAEPGSARPLLRAPAKAGRVGTTVRRPRSSSAWLPWLPRRASPPAAGSPSPSTCAQFPAEGRGCSVPARHGLPHRTSSVPGPTQLSGAGPAEREPGWFRPLSPPRNFAKLGSWGAGLGAEPEPTPHPRHSWAPLPAHSRAQGACERPTSLPKCNKVHFR